MNMRISKARMNMRMWMNIRISKARMNEDVDEYEN